MVVYYGLLTPGLKKARGPLLQLMEWAQPGFELLQDEEKFCRIMLHVNIISVATAGEQDHICRHEFLWNMSNQCIQYKKFNFLKMIYCTRWHLYIYINLWLIPRFKYTEIYNSTALHGLE